MASTPDNVPAQNLFPALSADDYEQMPTEMESLCVNCEKNVNILICINKIVLLNCISIFS